MASLEGWLAGERGFGLWATTPLATTTATRLMHFQGREIEEGHRSRVGEREGDRIVANFLHRYDRLDDEGDLAKLFPRVPLPLLSFFSQSRHLYAWVFPLWPCCTFTVSP